MTRPQPAPEPATPQTEAAERIHAVALRMKAKAARATSLLLTDFERVEAWCRDVTLVFHGYPVYLVGSALDRPDYRDIDLRAILPDAVFDRWWRNPVRTRLINHAVSTWGQRETGLPIDFQVQRDTEAGAFTGKRNMMGWRDWSKIVPAGASFDV